MMASKRKAHAATAAVENWTLVVTHFLSAATNVKPVYIPS